MPEDSFWRADSASRTGRGGDFLFGKARFTVGLSLLLLMTLGCGREATEFRLHYGGRPREEVSTLQEKAILETLREDFGTPDRPKVPTEVTLDLERIERAAGPGGRNFEGETVGLYRRYCANCHGISGDGAGPLALLFDPYPRDFRDGVYKYTSTYSGAQPLCEDLDRMIRQGIPASGMPAFDHFTSEEMDALIAYLKYLGIRGMTEKYLVMLVVDEKEYLPLGVDVHEMIEEDALIPVAEQWEMPELYPEEYRIQIPPPEVLETPEQLAASIARGKELYESKRTQCVSCHGPLGRGDGENSRDLYDIWNKPKKGVTESQTERLAEHYRLPLQRVRPRNFHQGLFRGGSRDIDVYRRIHAGIKGTPMPVAGTTFGVEGVLEPKEIWDLVHYVKSLSDKRPDDHELEASRENYESGTRD
jgi:mono/diheme cytochrome c family protein